MTLAAPEAAKSHWLVIPVGLPVLVFDLAADAIMASFRQLMTSGVSSQLPNQRSGLPLICFGAGIPPAQSWTLSGKFLLPPRGKLDGII